VPKKDKMRANQRRAGARLPSASRESHDVIRSPAYWVGSVSGAIGSVDPTQTEAPQT
jgi:hypothetical protein